MSATLDGEPHRASLQIRLLGPDDDAERAGRVVQAAYVALPDYPNDPGYHAHLGDVAGRCDNSEVFIGVLAGEIVACLTFVADPASEHNEFADDPLAASFRYFGVDPVVQGAGIGEAMVRDCIHQAQGRGFVRLRLHTLVSMVAAQRLYERIGFRRTPERDANWGGIIGLAYCIDLVDS